MAIWEDLLNIDIEINRGEDVKAMDYVRSLESRYRGSPAYWIRRAEVCFRIEEFTEGFEVLDKLEALINASRAALAPIDPHGSLVDSSTWQLLTRRAHMIAILVRGGLCPPEDLVNAWKDVLALRSGDIIDEIRTRHHLCWALQTAGRYEEAEAVFQDPAYKSITRILRRTFTLPQLLAWLNAFRRDPLAYLSPFAVNGRQRFILGLTVWGDEFLQPLLKFTLPSLLAEGNLPYLHREGEARLLIFASEATAVKLEASPIYRSLTEQFRCDLVVFPEELTAFPDTYRMMSTMHVAAMTAAQAASAHFFFLAPDIVMADNFLQVLEGRRRTGWEVVFVPGLMSNLQTMGGVLEKRYLPSVQPMKISPEDLLSLGLRHLHPSTLSDYFYAEEMRRASASVLLWRMANGGVIAHTFHSSPFLVSAEALDRYDGSMFYTIDGEFLVKIMKSDEHFLSAGLLVDLKETCYFELSRPDRRDHPTMFDRSRVIRWGSLQGKTARWLVEKKVYFKISNEIDNEAYDNSEEVMRTVVQGIDASVPALIRPFSS